MQFIWATCHMFDMFFLITLYSNHILLTTLVFSQSNYAGPIDDLDPDSNVLKLNKDLSSMEEVLSHSLQPKKFK
jgi:hypothetical protein